MSLAVYRLLYSFVKMILTWIKPLTGDHLHNWISLRQQKLQRLHELKDTYWFHASSGEIEYCKSVIRELKTLRPDAQIVVTYSSPSAEKLFNNITNLVTQFIPIPWDQEKILSPLFDYIKPAVLIFSRTDLWPELIEQAHVRSVPAGIISFNPKFNGLSKLSYQLFLQELDFVSCLDESAASKLKNFLPQTHIESHGDTRYDQVFFRLSGPSKITLKSDFPLIVFGSTWPEDEDVVLKSFKTIKERKIKIILSPHDVSTSNMERVRGLLKDLNFNYINLSEAVAQSPEIFLNHDILLIDQIGYLADCYRFADYAFVGGSFKDKVHSVMEPLCSGLRTITGPLNSNSPESVKYLNKFVFIANDEHELLSRIESFRSQPKSEVLAEMKKNRDASRRVLDFIQHNFLKN